MINEHLDETYRTNIRNYLIQRAHAVRVDAKLNLLNLAGLSEDFYAEFLNILLDRQFENANASERNKAGIDLIDWKNRAAVQVSATCALDTIRNKIRNSIKKFKIPEGDPWQFYFVPITDQAPELKSGFELPEGLTFDKTKDVLDIARIMELAKGIDKLRELSELVDKYSKGEALRKSLDDLLLLTWKAHRSFKLMQTDEIDKRLFPGIKESNQKEPVPFEALGKREGEEAESPVWSIIRESWKEPTNRPVMIQGKGGIGKTVTLFSVTEMDRDQLPAPAVYVPMFELVNQEDKVVNLTDYFQSADSFPSLTPKQRDGLCALAAKSWAGPSLLVLLDGFNEVPSAQRWNVLTMLRKWHEQNPGAQLIAVSRPMDNLSLKSAFGRETISVALSALSRETVAAYLQSFAGQGVRLPEPGAPIWETIVYPLFLNLYIKTDGLRYQQVYKDYPLAVREAAGPGSLIWNYLQRELLKKESEDWIIKIAVACEYIVPRIAYKMLSENRYTVSGEEIDGLTLQMLRELNPQHLPKHLRSIFAQYRHFHHRRTPSFSLNTEDEQDTWCDMVLRDAGLMIPYEGAQWSPRKTELQGEPFATDELYSFPHQSFRDCLAGLYLVNQAEMAEENVFPEIWEEYQSHMAMNYTADLMYPALYSRLWKANREAQRNHGFGEEKKRTAMFNLLDLWKQNTSLAEELDFSGMDLRGLSLTHYLGNEGPALHLFRDPAMTRKTKLDRSVFTSEGHSGRINALTVLPNGYVVSGSEDYTLRVWDSAVRQCLQILRGHAEPVTCAVSLPDGRVISGSEDATLRVWNPSTGESSQPLCGHTKKVVCVAYLSDNRAISGSADNTLRVWDLKKGCCIRVLNDYNGHTKKVHQLIVLPGGRVLSDFMDNSIRIWDTNNDTVIPISEKSAHAVICFAALSDNLIVSGSSDGILRVWDLKERRCVHALAGHTAQVNCVSILPDRRIVSAGYDNILRVWDLESKEPVNTLNLNRATQIEQLAALPDGKIVFHCWNSIVGLWDTSKDSFFKTLDDINADYTFTRCILALPNGPVVFGTTLGSVLLWDPTSKKQLQRMRRFSRETYYTTYFPDGCVFTALDDGTLRIWDLNKGRCIHTIKGYTRRITSAVALQGGKFASSSNETMIRIWDLKSERCCNILEGHTEEVTCLAICRDGSLVSGSKDRSIRIWDIQNGRCSRVLNGHIGGVNNVGCLPDGRIISNGEDSAMRIWDTSTGKCIRTIVGPPAITGPFAITAAGRIVGHGSDHQIHLWDMNNYKHIKCLYSNQTINWIRFIDMLPDGRVITSLDGRSIWAWDENVEKWDILPSVQSFSYAVRHRGKSEKSGVDNDLADTWWEIIEGEQLTFAVACLGNLIAVVSDAPKIRVIDSDTKDCIDMIEIMEIDVSEMDFSEAELDPGTMKFLYQNGARIPEKAEIQLSKQHKMSLADAYARRGNLLVKNGKVEEAVDPLNKAYAIYSDLGSQIGCANVLHSRGLLLSRLEKNADAFQSLKEAENLYQQVNSVLGLANIYRSMSEILSEVGRLEDGLSYSNRAIQCYTDGNFIDESAEMRLLQNDILCKIGKYDEALLSTDQAEKIFADNHNKRGQANAILARGNLMRMTGKFDVALQEYERAEDLFEKIQSSKGLADVRFFTGVTLIQTGDIDRAKSVLDKAEELYKDDNNNIGLANVLTLQGNLFTQANQAGSAVNAFRRAETIYKTEHNNPGIASVLFNRGLLLHEFIEDYEAAKESYEEAVKYYRRAQERVGLCLTLAFLHNCLIELGETESSEQYRKEAISLLPRLPENMQAIVEELLDL